MRNAVLGLAITPYLLFVTIDYWFHKNKRKVSLAEFKWHMAIGIALSIFFLAVFANSSIIAGIVFPFALVFMSVDELKFHRVLSIAEKRIHLAAGLSLLTFVAIWLWMIS